MPATVSSLKCTNVEANYLVIDTLRVERVLLAEIFVHWQEGFEGWISQGSGKPIEDVRARFNEMIACAKEPNRYVA